MPLFESPVFDSPVFDGDASSGGGFGMCCGCGNGTPTYLACDVTCTPTTYTTSVAQTYCFSLAGVTTSGVCDSVGGRYTAIRISLCGDGCPTQDNISGGWVNINTDRTDTICNVFSCFGPPWDGSGGEPSWQIGMSYFCSAYSEPMMVLFLQGNTGGAFAWNVYYTCPLDTFDWTGPNTFDLYSQNAVASTYFTFPASLVLTPCANPAGLP